MRNKTILFAALSFVVTASLGIPPASAQQQISGTITIQVDASDEPGGSGLALVELYVDGNLVSQTNSSGSLQYAWDTTAVQDDQHTLFAQATDNAGNQGQGSLDVIVDNSVPNPDTEPPTITIQIVSE